MRFFKNTYQKIFPQERRATSFVFSDYQERRATSFVFSDYTEQRATSFVYHPNTNPLPINGNSSVALDDAEHSEYSSDSDAERSPYVDALELVQEELQKTECDDAFVQECLTELVRSLKQFAVSLAAPFELIRPGVRASLTLKQQFDVVQVLHAYNDFFFKKEDPEHYREQWEFVYVTKLLDAAKKASYRTPETFRHHGLGVGQQDAQVIIERLAALKDNRGAHPPFETLLKYATQIADLIEAQHFLERNTPSADIVDAVDWLEQYRCYLKTNLRELLDEAMDIEALARTEQSRLRELLYAEEAMADDTRVWPAFYEDVVVPLLHGLHVESTSSTRCYYLVLMDAEANDIELTEEERVLVEQAGSVVFQGVVEKGEPIWSIHFHDDQHDYSFRLVSDSRQIEQLNRIYAQEKTSNPRSVQVNRPEHINQLKGIVASIRRAFSATNAVEKRFIAKIAKDALLKDKVTAFLTLCAELSCLASATADHQLMPQIITSVSALLSKPLLRNVLLRVDSTLWDNSWNALFQQLFQYANAYPDQTPTTAWNDILKTVATTPGLCRPLKFNLKRWLLSQGTSSSTTPPQRYLPPTVEHLLTALDQSASDLQNGVQQSGVSPEEQQHAEWILKEFERIQLWLERKAPLEDKKPPPLNTQKPPRTSLALDTLLSDVVTALYRLRVQIESLLARQELLARRLIQQIVQAKQAFYETWESFVNLERACLKVMQNTINAAQVVSSGVVDPKPDTAGQLLNGVGLVLKSSAGIPTLLPVTVILAGFKAATFVLSLLNNGKNTPASAVNARFFDVGVVETSVNQWRSRYENKSGDLSQKTQYHNLNESQSFDYQDRARALANRLLQVYADPLERLTPNARMVFASYLISFMFIYLRQGYLSEAGERQDGVYVNELMRWLALADYALLQSGIEGLPEVLLTCRDGSQISAAALLSQTGLLCQDDEGQIFRFSYGTQDPEHYGYRLATASEVSALNEQIEGGYCSGTADKKASVVFHYADDLSRYKSCFRVIPSSWQSEKARQAERFLAIEKRLKQQLQLIQALPEQVIAILRGHEVDLEALAKELSVLCRRREMEIERLEERVVGLERDVQGWAQVAKELSAVKQELEQTKSRVTELEGTVETLTKQNELLEKKIAHQAENWQDFMEEGRNAQEDGRPINFGLFLNNAAGDEGTIDTPAATEVDTPPEPAPAPPAQEAAAYAPGLFAATAPAEVPEDAAPYVHEPAPRDEHATSFSF